MKHRISGMESDGGESGRRRGGMLHGHPSGDEHRRRLFRSAHLAATPQNYTGTGLVGSGGGSGGGRRDKNGNVSGGRLSRAEGGGGRKRPFNLAGGASATLNNNNVVASNNNNNNHEKSPPLPPKRTRSVTNALAVQSHSNSSSPGSVDSKDKSSGSPNSSVSQVNLYNFVCNCN